MNNVIATAKDPATSLRMPARLKAKVEKSAQANGRSFNTEVLVRLVASFSLPRTK